MRLCRTGATQLLAPEGKFRPTMRLYSPRPETLGGGSSPQNGWAERGGWREFSFPGVVGHHPPAVIAKAVSGHREASQRQGFGAQQSRRSHRRGISGRWASNPQARWCRPKNDKNT
jgi:hypothetical protein